MNTYIQFRRKAFAEMIDWHPQFNMTGVYVDGADKKAGSPKLGDKIARNPSDHSDRWLISSEYFEENFEY